MLKESAFFIQRLVSKRWCLHKDPKRSAKEICVTIV